MPRFDSITHITHDGRWLGASRYDASAERLLSEMEQSQVDRACLVALADHIENSIVADLTRRFPDRFVPIAAMNPASLRTPAAASEAIGKLADQGFAGVKLHPRLNGFDPLDERCLATIRAAGQYGIPIFLDTMFRQPGRPTRHAADVIDEIAVSCSATKIVLLHGGAAALLDLFELVRMHSHLILDLSCTIIRYAHSSLDDDLRFTMANLDQRVCVGSDFPEFTLAAAFARADYLMADLPAEKQERILYGNLAALFANWKGLK